MADAWNSPWNGLTSQTALAIDNEQAELEVAVNMAMGALTRNEDGPPARVDLADKLKARYMGKLERIAPFEGTTSNFGRHLAGFLLLEAVGNINWFGLAEHYLQMARERKAKQAK